MEKFFVDKIIIPNRTFLVRFGGISYFDEMQSSQNTNGETKRAYMQIWVRKIPLRRYFTKPSRITRDFRYTSVNTTNSRDYYPLGNKTIEEQHRSAYIPYSKRF